MSNHILKTDSEVFDKTLLGIKQWEIRLNDRGFKVGDLITLRETTFTGAEMSQGKPLVYTGRELQLIIRFILQNLYGLKDGWCVMSVEIVNTLKSIKVETND